MSGKQLKNSILQWAIQGKLVPQDPNDEPASVLLDKIRQEKERLIKEKKIKRDKNASIIYRGEDNSHYEKMLATGEVKCIDEEIPFEIPKGWEWCRVTDLMLKITDGTHRSPTNTDNGEYMYITAKNIKEDGISLANITFVSKDVHDEIYSRCNPEYGDLLYIKDGATTGIVTINNIKKPFSLLSSVALLKPTSEINTNYILNFLRTPSNLECVRNSMKGCAITRITLRQIEKWLVPVPPHKEQQRIVDLINELLPYLDKYSSLQINLDLLNVNINDKLKKSILQEAIQGKLVSQLEKEGTAKELLEQIKAEKQKLVKEGKLKKSALNDSVIFRGDDNRYYASKNKDTICIDDEIPFEIPDSWVWVRFGTIMINRDRERIPLSVAQRQFLSKRYDYYGASGVIDKVDRYLFDKELLLIGEDGANLLNRSTPIAFIAKGKYWVNNHAHVLDVYDGVMLKYIALYINSISLVPYVTGTAQPKMNQEKMNSILIALPPQKEQQRIVAQIEKLFEQLH